MSRLHLSVLVVSLFLGFSLCAVFAANPIIADGLVAYWSFNKGTINGAVIKDQSEVGQNAIDTTAGRLSVTLSLALKVK